MQAGAEQLLASPERWMQARRKADGREFWIVRGRTSTYFTRHDACTCPGFTRRGICSHSLAATMRDARQASQQTPCELPATFAIGGPR
jgi:predicted nucleic acid-binding Zn finger protein